MDEDGTTAAPAEPVAPDNINSEEGGVSADEVADVLHLPKNEGAEPEEPETPAEEPEKPKDPEPPAPAAEELKPDEPKPEVAAAPAPEAPTFTVEVEDANGKKFTVGPGDNLEELLAEFEPKNNGQVIQLIRDLDKLEVKKSDWEKEQADSKAEEARSEQIATIQEGWDKEIQKLQGDKRLPLDSKIEDRKNEVFKFMADENEKRDQAGEPLISSFKDALNGLELQERTDAAIQAKKDAKDEQRRRGGMVGGSSAPATTSAPVYHSGTARNASEAISNLGLLPK